MIFFIIYIFNTLNINNVFFYGIPQSIDAKLINWQYLEVFFREYAFLYHQFGEFSICFFSVFIFGAEINEWR
tara:strand:+ start:215 stop:430 length:216 start_codon:yes stop_codon:yes gene_type:complete